MSMNEYRMLDDVNSLYSRRMPVRSTSYFPQPDFALLIGRSKHIITGGKCNSSDSSQWG